MIILEDGIIILDIYFRTNKSHVHAGSRKQETLPLQCDDFELTNEYLDYLSEQIITYIGNKRSLLDFIGKGIEVVCKRLGRNKISSLDAFSGSGVVSRYLRRFSSSLHCNDLEDYSRVINECYMTNESCLKTSYLAFIKELKNLGMKELLQKCMLLPMKII